MKWIEVPIGSNQDATTRLRGLVAQCPDCGCREWWLFRLGALDQRYVQCMQCDRIDTADGSPAEENALRAYALLTDRDVMHPLSVPGKEVAP